MAGIVIANRLLKHNIRKATTAPRILKHNINYSVVKSIILKHGITTALVKNVILKHNIGLLNLLRVSKRLIMKDVSKRINLNSDTGNSVSEGSN